MKTHEEGQPGALALGSCSALGVLTRAARDVLDAWDKGANYRDMAPAIAALRAATPEIGQWVIEWNAGYDIFYWVGDCEVGWGKINPTDGDIFKAIIYSRRDLAENDLPRAKGSRSNARIVPLPNYPDQPRDERSQNQNQNCRESRCAVTGWLASEFPMTKEQIYDEKISPLMTQIIAVCQEHKISMFATYDIPNDEDETLACTTCTADESGKPSERIRQFNRRVPSPMMLTTEHADGTKTMTAILG